MLSQDYLYRNNGDGTFTDVATAAGIAYNSEGRATASMGIANGDYDNDGALGPIRYKLLVGSQQPLPK